MDTEAMACTQISALLAFALPYPSIHPFINTQKAAVIIKYTKYSEQKKYTKGIK